MNGDLVYYAGPAALSLIRDGGLTPDRVAVVAGAAGGPKWLVLSHLDRFLFSHWFRGRRHPLFLLGASNGAWRFAAVCRLDPSDALEAFERAYIYQFYPRRPTPETVSKESRRIMAAYLGGDGVDEVLNHPFLRPSFLTVRARHLCAAESRVPQLAGLTAAVAANILDRSLLRFFFNRVMFYHPADDPPCWPIEGFSSKRVPLSSDNLMDALLASGSIPMVMSGVRDITGAPAGTYRDGGALDYHLDIPHSIAPDTITLFPHYSERIIPGWLDKSLPWRKPSPSSLATMLLVTPSPSFVATLPDGRISDRTDFQRFAGNDNARIDSWRQVVARGKRLSESFAEAVISGRIRHLVQPFP